MIWFTAISKLEDMSLVDDELYSIARSSAYRARWILLGMLSEISMKKRLNRVGDRQLPCGTPVLVMKMVEIDFFQVTWKVLSSRKFLIQFRRSVGSPAFASLNMIPSCDALAKAFSTSNSMQPVYCLLLKPSVII